ncbi:MAG: mechanosensitive ion channel family protein [Acidaminococcaceae bacterium]
MNIIPLYEPWLLPLAIFSGFVVLRYLFRTIVMRWLKVMTSKTVTTIDEEIVDAINHPLQFLFLVAGVYFALKFSPLTTLAEHIISQHLIDTAIIGSVCWSLFNLSSTTDDILTHILASFGLKLEASLVNIVSAFTRFLLVSISFAMIVSEWGYDINGFIAGLSLGGLAISLAAKDALANVFGSIVIIMDKPFVVGDWISASGVEGTVEKISFRSTSVRTFQQALVYIPNSILCNTPIMNHTKREKRRIEFTLGLTYSATATQIKQTVSQLREYLWQNEAIYNEDLTVTFNAFGASSLNIFVICYTKTTSYVDYLSLKEDINLQLLEILAANGVTAAFPSTSVYFETPLSLKDKV